MRKGTFQYIEQILVDYNQTEKHIQQRINELKYPVQIVDENIGGGKSPFTSNVPERLAVTIADDVLLYNLRKNHNAVKEVLESADEEYVKVINLYYINQPRLYRWDGVAEQTGYSEKQCRNIRNVIFDKIAEKLGMPK